MYRAIRAAFGFLTVLPVSAGSEILDDLKRAVKFFPLVGAFYGGVTWLLLRFFIRFLPAELAAGVVLFMVICLNGGMHLDGWADTADALGSRESSRSLEIMKDSRLGSFGGAAICFLLIGMVFSLSRLAAQPVTVFVAVSALSRWCMSWQIYRRPSVSRGVLQGLLPGRRKWDPWVSAFLTAAFVAPAGLKGLMLFGSALAALIFMNRLTEKRFGGITGDTLGALNELAELSCYILLNIT